VVVCIVTLSLVVYVLFLEKMCRFCQIW